MHGMSRSEIWNWFKFSTPAKSKAKKPDESDKNLVKVKAVLDIEGDRIIIGMWGGHESMPCGVYYMTPSGEHWWSKNGKWQRGKVVYMPKDWFEYWKPYPRNKYRWIGDAKTVIGSWVKSHFGDQPFYHDWKDDPIDVLDDIERNLSSIKRYRTNQRRRSRITDWVHTIPDLPPDFGEWAGRVAFKDVHYAIGKKGSTEYICTSCRQKIHADGWKNNKWYSCPVCDARVQARKGNGCFRDAHERVSVYIPHKDMDGRPCVVMVTLYAEKRWRAEGESLGFAPARVAILPKNGTTCEHGLICYHHGCDTWDSVNKWGFKCSDHYLYPFEPKILTGTYYEDIDKVLLAASMRGWKLNWDNFMYCRSRAHVFEYLIKGGFERLVKENAGGRYTGGAILKWRGENAEEVLLIDRQRINRLKAANGGSRYLDWLRADFMCGFKLKEETLKWLEKNITPTEMAFALELPGMTVERAANYIKKQIDLNPTYRSYYGTTRAEGVAQLWRDYLGVAKTLGIDLTMEYNFKPKNLKARHDELNELLSIKKRQEQMEAEKAALAEKAERMEAKYPQVAPVCEKIKEIYEYSDETYSVIVPANAWEVMQEGVLLGHCTSRDEENVYLERIERETSYIMFLRKNQDRDRPWYTMEVEPGGNVIQLRTYGDKEGEDRAEAKAFLGKWRRKIAKRCGQGELTKAKRSREELLKYWDGLRVNGNIIRRGYLQGKLLVDVLQADYKELNGELPKEEVG